MSDDQPSYPDSKESLENGDSSNSQPGPKRRASRAGTRSVASLTPEQLARKRANDREAQRSIRQRTKNHIEELEQRIRELSKDQDARNYERIKRRNAELEEELRQLREAIGQPEDSVASPELTPLPSRYGMDTLEERHPLASSPSWNPPTSVNRSEGSFLSFSSSSAGDELSIFASDHIGLHSEFSDSGSARSDTFNSDLSFQDVTSAPMVAAAVRRGGPNSRPQFGRSRLYPDGIFGLTAGHTSSRVNGSVSRTDPSPLTAQPISPINNTLIMNGHVHTMHQPIPPPNSHLLTVNIEKATIDSQAGIPQHGTTTYDSSSVSHQQALPTWKLSLRFVPPTGPVDSILIGLLQRQRSSASKETPGSVLIGPYHPDLRALVKPEISSKVHPVSSIISNLVQRIPFPGLAEKAAALFLVYHFCQWQIWPTVETYNNIPEWLHPRASQLVTAHPIWSTLLVWGKARDIVVRNQEKYATEEFMDLYQSSINVNWPFGEEEILMFVGEEVRVTDAFIRHIETQANWSLNESFQRRYPEFMVACRFTELPVAQMNGNAH